MNDVNRRFSELATRMRGFARMQDGEFPPQTISGQRFVTLDILIAKYDDLGAKQAQERGAAMAATELKNTIREDIRRRLQNIRKTALSIEAQQPGISLNFQMPSSQSEESLIEAARAFVAAATPRKALFLSREMPENFLEELTDAIQRFEEVVENINLHSANSKAATELLDSLGPEVLEVRRELDPMIRNKYRDDPEKLALWETTSHLERPAKRAASKKTNGTPAPPTAGQA